jgi:hypothetical protein
VHTINNSLYQLNAVLYILSAFLIKFIENQDYGVKSTIYL